MDAASITSNASTLHELHEFVVDRTLFYLNFYEISFLNYLDHVAEHILVFLIVYATLALLLYSYQSRVNRVNDLTTSKRILFVTAHPDDECMFFGPTISKLSKCIVDCKIYLVCMSQGTFDGDGATRREELWNSCRVLGIPDENVVLINHSELLDNPEVKWSDDVVARIVIKLIEQVEIDTVITFDRDGVSKHLNHIALFYSLAHLFVTKQLPSYCTVYTLESVNILKKYCFMFDLPLSMFLSSNCLTISLNERKRVVAAMHEHKSQLKWFRRLFLIFSRYTWINTLHKMDEWSLEMDLDDDLN